MAATIPLAARCLGAVPSCVPAVSITTRGDEVVGLLLYGITQGSQTSLSSTPAAIFSIVLFSARAASSRFWPGNVHAVAAQILRLTSGIQNRVADVWITSWFTGK